MGTQRGTLHVVATPIGNLADLSARARETLQRADLIAAEDTRHTQRLLNALGISRPLLSLHAHNEAQRTTEVMARLEAGENVALVSDAGTPLMSDPGCTLVAAAAAAGIPVVAVPGPCSIVAALAVAGLPTARFCFEGFLPARAGERRDRLEALVREERTLVFFEAPHRIRATLADLAASFGPGRRAAVAREMTKLHETVYRGELRELIGCADQDPDFARGELTVVVAGAPAASPGVDATELRRVVTLLLQELPPGRAAALAAGLTGAPRAAAYAIADALAKAQRGD